MPTKVGSTRFQELTPRNYSLRERAGPKHRLNFSAISQIEPELSPLAAFHLLNPLSE